MDLSRNLIKSCENHKKESEAATDSLRHIVEVTYNTSEIESDASDGEAARPGWGSPGDVKDSRSG